MVPFSKSDVRRWFKFNAVGVMGTAVQLFTLTMLLRFWPTHFLWASALAVEVAVIHNFLWHWEWTWADRRSDVWVSRLRPFCRFNLSNGLISIVGTALCTQFLTGTTHRSPLVANTLALVPCCIANFLVSDRLVFGRSLLGRRTAFTLVTSLICVSIPVVATAATLQSATLQTWNTCVQLTEKRIASELSSSAEFLNRDFMKPADSGRIQSLLQTGQVVVERMPTPDAAGHEIHIPEGLVHHWYGSVFVPDMTLPALLTWLQNYDRHSQYFKEVEQSRLVSRNGDTFQVFLRLVQTKVLTVRYNTEHTVTYSNNGPGRASSRSVATRIAEIRDSGSPFEKEQLPGDDSGYLWRLNSYWRFREQNGGVVVECETLSLSRSIPYGLEWLIGDYLESIPRETLKSTLSSIRDGVRTGH